MSSAQKKAVKTYRDRLNRRGLSRFEVLGRPVDRELIRSLARRLAEDDEEATGLRAAMKETLSGKPPRKGGILTALRRSPLVGADIEIRRPTETGRPVNL